MAYTRKTKDIYIILTNYGTGWEEESDAETLQEAQAQAKEYRRTAAAPLVRIKKRRIKNDAKGTI